MGMSWAEVHEEAEQLEHVVSERLIERMDEMLGHPTHDPHGDPIPTPEGAIPTHHLDNLLTCPLGVPLKVMRIADQDAAFLRFIESNNLKPGQSIQVETRDAAADAVRVGGGDRAVIIIGTRAASKLLVEVLALVFIVLFMFGQPAGAQPAPAPPPEPFEITDNSFLVEEAFNQESGIFQNVLGWSRDETGAWQSGFTQEWPLGGMTHQFSYTIPFSGGSPSTHLDAVLINYRYQALVEGPGRPAFSPRLSLILPTGPRGGSGDRPGLQINLPFSKQAGDLYFHWNGGVTWVEGVEVGDGSTADLTSPFLAGSAIWRTTPLFHLMMETVVEWEESIEVGEIARERSLTLSPGLRWGWNLGEQQIVIGLAAPVTTTDAETNIGVFTYFSYELPFQKS
jgi:hypothetical protein